MDLLTDQIDEYKKYWCKLIDLLPTEPPDYNILNWIEGRRLMPAGSPIEGFFYNDITPYLTEIYENMSPSSTIQHTAMMKSVQSGVTTMAENCIAYYIGCMPAEILYISGTKQLLTSFSTRKLDPLLSSCDLTKLLAPLSSNTKSRRSGDTIMLKEYPGGSLALASAQSASQLRFTSRRVMVRDEIDSAPKDLKNDEGDWLSVSEKRTLWFGSRKKILDISTPISYDHSNINKLFEVGDQRHYEIPCLSCGEFQEITFKQLVPVYDGNDHLAEIYYPCRACGHRHYNHHKSQFLKLGKWVPKAISKSPFYRSYYLNGTYSPVGLVSWEDLRNEYDEALTDHTKEKMKAFETLSLGVPYRDITTKPKLERVVALRGTYKQKEVQPGVLFLTAAIDVQTGPKDPRLEIEVCGHGAQFRTWSIDYIVVRGEVHEASTGAWLELKTKIEEGLLTYKRRDGATFIPQAIFIDTGDGNIAPTVYQVIELYHWDLQRINEQPRVTAIKGFGTLKSKSTRQMIRYRQNSSKRFLEINTNLYKRFIYLNLESSCRSFDNLADIQDTAFCHFPAEYGEHYFKMLTAEDAMSDGTFHCPSGRRNEALDCRVYNLCAADYFLANFKEESLKKLIGQGFPRDKVEKEVTTQWVLERFATETKQEYPYRPKDLAAYLESKKN